MTRSIAFILLGMISCSTAYANPLPLNDGRYVTDPELCFLSEEQMNFAYGDRVGQLTRTISGPEVSDAYEMSCTVSKAKVSGKALQFEATCSTEGAEEHIRAEYTLVSENAFRAHGELFRRCGSDAAISKYDDYLDADTGELVRLYDDANSRCRGGSGDDPKTFAACGERDSYYSMIGARGWCFGENAAAGYQQFWAPCVARFQ